MADGSRSAASPPQYVPSKDRIASLRAWLQAIWLADNVPEAATAWNVINEYERLLGASRDGGASPPEPLARLNDLETELRELAELREHAQKLSHIDGGKLKSFVAILCAKYRHALIELAEWRGRATGEKESGP